MAWTVTLADEDVRFLDAYAERHGITSRSEVLQRAIELLRQADLADCYQAAWTEWDLSSDSEIWGR